MPEPVPPFAQSRRTSRRRPPKGEVRAACRLGIQDLGADLPVCVLDLSETGVRLLSRRPLEPGQPLSVWLGRQDGGRPAPRAATVVLVPALDGRGALRRGPLPQALALQGLVTAHSGAGRPRPGVPPLPCPVPAPAVRPGGYAEKRRSARHALRPMRRCRVSPGGGRPDLDATLLDLSQTGAGLMASGPFGRGQAVVLRLEAAGAAPADLPAQVVYAAELNVGWFLVGAEFARPLPGEQLLPLVARMGRLAPGELLELTQGPPGRA